MALSISVCVCVCVIFMITRRIFAKITNVKMTFIDFDIRHPMAPLRIHRQLDRIFQGQIFPMLIALKR